jgi:uncharacterized protein YneF (UPF0154 family)
MLAKATERAVLVLAITFMAGAAVGFFVGIYI